jgi:hypothetical protein
MKTASLAFHRAQLFPIPQSASDGVLLAYSHNAGTIP